MKLYNKGIPKSGRVDKYISDPELEKLIDEYIESGEHGLGIDIIRFLHWEREKANERSKIVSEHARNQQMFEYYMSIDPDEKQALLNIGRRREKTKLINTFFAIQNRLIGYDEIRRIIESEGGDD